ncbi:O-antigen ligase family protein [Flavobacterium sp. NG2]|uniref:O-antigen ligase family protein n=1 Tax=Flavobacterium sp. NG2 TaxID=3097547 RepID=UPI002A830A40|nr:O-antigen ligase family protein [Flavobacterium sp. NG2]WPR72265.1 O-antigen ligase family protein [Flavobacterium sp. NG2]
MITTYIILFYIKDIPNHHFDWYLVRFNLEQQIKIHGTYISLWISIAFLFITDYIIHLKKIKLKYGLIILQLTSLMSLIIVNSRMILFSTILLSFLQIYFYFHKKIKTYKLIIPLLLTTILISLFSNRYKDDILFLYKNSIKDSSRYTICYCSIETIKKSHYLGLNNETIQEKLNDCYDKYGFKELSKENINSHNQYLDFFLKGGLVLFISFLSILLIKLYKSFKTKNFLYFLITLLFTFSFLTENILVRQYGIYIYLFCDILFLGSILGNKSHCCDKIEKS